VPATPKMSPTTSGTFWRLALAPSVLKHDFTDKKVFMDAIDEADTLTITHVARNRGGFAEGALLAANWINGRQGFFEFSEIMDYQIAGQEE